MSHVESPGLVDMLRRPGWPTSGSSSSRTAHPFKAIMTHLCDMCRHPEQPSTPPESSEGPASSLAVYYRLPSRSTFMATAKTKMAQISSVADLNGIPYAFQFCSIPLLSAALAFPGGFKGSYQLSCCSGSVCGALPEALPTGCSCTIQITYDSQAMP